VSRLVTAVAHADAYVPGGFNNLRGALVVEDLQ
jgi:hypothetical protein